MHSEKLFKSFILGFLCLLYIYLLATPINLTTADLGRHIKNGEVILSGNFEVLYKNIYSYTYPDFPFVNHHFGSGVLFYLIYRISGFTGLHLFYILISLLTFLIFFDLARKYANFYKASLVSLLVIPVIAYRNEVRPEALSYLFAGIYFWILSLWNTGKLPARWLFALPVLELLWVNLHVYFFLGFLILGAFGMENFIKWLTVKKKENLSHFKYLTVIGLLSFLTSLINPNFINGLIYPVKIYGNYGYRVLENQSIFFLQKIITVPAILYFEIALLVLLLSWFYAIWRSYKSKTILNLKSFILSLIVSWLAITQVRNFTLFGFFALSIMSINFKDLKLSYSKFALLPVMTILLLIMLVINPRYWEGLNFGIGLSEGGEDSARFFKQNNLKGPIFNNYDIGSYLIFELYPRELVFVDNRPEAYPANFFDEQYIPIQEDETKWKQAEEKYHFNSIYFMRNDLTPWAQKFLISRIKDETWAPIYVDSYSIIFLKRIDQNMESIKKYELPKNLFKTP